MRARIGVALGSGAARGWAHIGVLEGLAALGIVPEIVAGTSIGALVGAAFATGRLAALKTRMENFSRRDVAAMLDLRLTTGGLTEGKRVEDFLDGLGIVGSIETLGSRYCAVATDLASGREIWLQQGPIGHAVRASIGMPGLFTPTRHDDRWLIDGGLVNPVPVSVAQARAHSWRGCGRGNREDVPRFRGRLDCDGRLQSQSVPAAGIRRPDRAHALRNRPTGADAAPLTT